MMSIGGWDGSQYFSSAMATDANRTAFAQTVMNLVSTYKLDGVEFEYVSPHQFRGFTIRAHPSIPQLGVPRYAKHRLQRRICE